MASVEIVRDFLSPFVLRAPWKSTDSTHMTQKVLGQDRNFQIIGIEPTNERDWPLFDYGMEEKESRQRKKHEKHYFLNLLTKGLASRG